MNARVLVKITTRNDQGHEGRRYPHFATLQLIMLSYSELKMTLNIHTYIYVSELAGPRAS